MGIFMKKIVLYLLILSVTSLLLSPKLNAKASRIYTYPSDALYLSVYRFLTLKKNFKVVKENPEMGLIVFRYEDSSVTDNSSSIEVIKDAQGIGNHRVRIQIPSISEGTERLLLQELNEDIKNDFSPPKMNEKVFDYTYDQLLSSIYRYFTIEEKFDIDSMDKDKGIIRFKVNSSSSSADSSCQIFKYPKGGYKVRMVSPFLAGSSIGMYLGKIKDKLKSDYSKD